MSHTHTHTQIRVYTHVLLSSTVREWKKKKGEKDIYILCLNLLLIYFLHYILTNILFLKCHFVKINITTYEKRGIFFFIFHIHNVIGQLSSV